MGFTLAGGRRLAASLGQIDGKVAKCCSAVEESVVEVEPTPVPPPGSKGPLPAPGWPGLERPGSVLAPGMHEPLGLRPRRDGRERARGGDTRARGRAASVARERVREDSRPFTAQQVRHPLRPDRTVHIIFWLDLTVIGLAGDVALLGALGLIQESYIEIASRGHAVVDADELDGPLNAGHGPCLAMLGN